MDSKAETLIVAIYLVLCVIMPALNGLGLLDALLIRLFNG